MSDFDLAAPSVPYQKHKDSGLLNRFFKKPQQAAPVPAPAKPQPAAPQNINLEEIKKKLGLDDELPPLQPMPSPAPSAPATMEVQIQPKPDPIKVKDWTSSDDPTPKPIAQSQVVEVPLPSPREPTAAPAKAPVIASAPPAAPKVSSQKESAGWTATPTTERGTAAAKSADWTATGDRSADAKPTKAAASSSDWTKTAEVAETRQAKSPPPSAWSAPAEPTPAAPVKPAKQATDWAASAEKPTAKTPVANPEFHQEPVPASPQPEVTVHHDMIEQHLDPIDKQREKLEETLKKVSDSLPDIPDWKLQQKEVAPERYFILRNGQPIKSLKDLIEALEYIDDSTFDHHVNEYRNDFSNWIRDAVQDPDLALRVQNAKDKDRMRDILNSHRTTAGKNFAKEQQTIQAHIKKREVALEKLNVVDDQFTDLKKELEERTRDLLNERKRTAKLIKDRLDDEVKRTLIKERNTLAAVRSDLGKTKQAEIAKAKENEALSLKLAEREKNVLLKEQKANQLQHDADAAQAKLAEDKKNAQQLLKDADSLKKQFEDMKKLDAVNKKNMETLTKRDAEIRRREDSLAQREKKVTADLTKIQAGQDTMLALKDELAKREIAAKKMETDSTAFRDDAEERAKAALDMERNSTGRMKEDMRKLETLRKAIDLKLSKALGQKKKITDAIALRKELERNITTTKQEVRKERDEMEEDSYKTLVSSRLETTAIGQPDNETDIADQVSNRQLPIYQKIEECRTALDRQDIQQARSLYNELREQFGKLKAEPMERSAIYTSIRELYDDIHLMMLG